MSGATAPGETLLAHLMAQADGRVIDRVTMRALVEEASEAGAARALASLGLGDPSARRDMDELRELLSAWRDAKRSAQKAVWQRQSATDDPKYRRGSWCEILMRTWIKKCGRGCAWRG